MSEREESKNRGTAIINNFLATITICPFTLSSYFNIIPDTLKTGDSIQPHLQRQTEIFSYSNYLHICTQMPRIDRKTFES